MRPRTSLILAALLALACSRKSAPLAESPRSDDEAFHIVETNSTAVGETRYLAQAGGHCEFEILIAKPKPAPGSPFAFAGATLVRRPGADCTPFLKALAPKLGFKGDLPSPPPAAELKATAGILGANQSRSQSTKGLEVEGRFSSTPPGPWMAMKLFLADGEGEVYLNLNAHDHIGEFSVKDEDYAGVVVGELAKLLLPASR